MKTLIKNATVVTLNEQGDVLTGNVLIDGDRIAAVGAVDAEAGRVIDAEGGVVAPAFFNMHTHIAMSVLRGYADDIPLMDWLEQKVWPAEDRLNDEWAYYASMLSLIEMAKGGTVGFSDMYYLYPGCCRAIEQSGLRGVIARSVVSPTPEVGAAKLREMIDNYREYNGKGRMRAIFSAHAQYTNSTEMLREMAAVAREHSVAVHMHISETRSEHEQCVRQTGKTPIGLALETGLLDGDFLAAHCVHVSDEDIEIMRERNVVVCSCPKSNLKLGSGVAPIAAFLRRGVRVTLGTDSAASNNTQSMWDEMRFACYLQKGVNLDPTVLPAMQALRLATQEGYRALGLEGGVIEAGAPADLIVVAREGERSYPRFDNIASYLVYAADDRQVRMTMVGGDVVYENGRVTFADEEEIYRKAEEFRARIGA